MINTFILEYQKEFCCGSITEYLPIKTSLSFHEINSILLENNIIINNWWIAREKLTGPQLQNYKNPVFKTLPGMPQFNYDHYNGTVPVLYTLQQWLLDNSVEVTK